MEKFTIIFNINNKLLQYDMELLLGKRKGIFLSNEIFPFEGIPFPIFSKDDQYYVDNIENQGWSVFLDGEVVLKDKELIHGNYLMLTSRKIHIGILFLEVSQCTLHTRKIMLERNQEVFIGSSMKNNIVININNSISKRHCVIHIDANHKAYIEDLDKKTGIFVNGEKVVGNALFCGDRIEIMGSTICYMENYLLVPRNLQIHGMKSLTEIPRITEQKEEEMDEYSRTLRVFPSFNESKIVIDAPPQPQQTKQIPFLLVAGPSITMALAMFVSFIMTLSNAINIAAGGAMIISMLMGAIVWPSLSRNYYRKQEIEREEYRVKKYKTYLLECENEIEKRYEEYKKNWNQELFPSVRQIINFIIKRENRLWERSCGEKDFLEIRLGIGEKKFEVEIQYPKKSFSLNEDPLLDEIDAMVQKYRKFNAPITISFNEKRTVGITGWKEDIYNIARCIFVKIAALYSPEEVKLGIVCNLLQKDELEWMAEIPHCWNVSGNMRYLAETVDEVEQLFSVIDEKFKAGGDEYRKTHLIVFVFDKNIVENSSYYHYFVGEGRKKGISAVFISEIEIGIPKECEAIICPDQGKNYKLYIKNENNNQFISFFPDSINRKDTEEVIKSLSHIMVKIQQEEVDIPEQVEFLELYQTGNVQSLKISQRWEHNHSEQSLAVPIGMKTGKELFYLDIHQNYHGCHGLVAGTTGSGKSEFLQAYILSLLINYSPNEVALVLVDFKGGDMARPFLKVPHLSATISNLSGNILYRAMVSLEAEKEARQKIFNEAAKKLGIDKIDINIYQRYFKEGMLFQPLPHLIIVIDEFAQLKTQHPEFMSKLIDIAQVGRSLGIHLILATQKPSGVVDPQIWSNSRFKVCLKVLDKQDSTEMLRRADAATIKLPGRAFVQIGYDEIFEQIQSGFSGAEYIEQTQFKEDSEITVKLVDSTAMPLRMAKNMLGNKGDNLTQLEAVVQEVIRIAKEKRIKAEPLWLDTLPAYSYLENCFIGFRNILRFSQIDIDTNITAVCGKMDLIKIQRQMTYQFSFADKGHLAIYGASGSGKTTLIQTIVFSLILKYSPEMLNIIVFDYGGRNLGKLEQLPHCLSVVYGDEEKKTASMLDQILQYVNRRKYLFAEKQCNDYKTYLRVCKKKIPAILLIIDNCGDFYEKMFSEFDKLVQLASNASAYGVYLLLTGNSKNAIHHKISEHIANCICLYMNDRLDYRDIFNRVCKIEPDNIKGRGLVLYEEEVVEFQAALSLKAENEAEYRKDLDNIYERIKEKYKDHDCKKSFFEIENIKYDDENKNIKDTEEVYHANKTTDREHILPIAEDDGNTIITGTSVVNGQLQGFCLKDINKIFIGLNGEEYPSKIMKCIRNMKKNTKIFNVFPRNKKGLEENIYRTKEQLHEMVCYIKVHIASSYMEKERIIILIEDFCAFFDCISDEDMDIFVEILNQIQGKEIYCITIDSIERMEDYYDTALYLHLIKTEAGLIIGGEIDDNKAAKLYRMLIEIPSSERKLQLALNEAFMFYGREWSVIQL